MQSKLVLKMINKIQENKNSKAIVEYDIIRILATILVVLGHAAYTTMQTPYGGMLINAEFSLVQRALELFVRLIYTFHMPLFFALSGALFNISLKTKGIMSFRQLISNKSQRLLLPFILVTMLYSLPLKYLSGYYDSSINVIRDMIFGQVFLLGNSHLWFLVALFLIFLMAWCLERYVASKKLKLLIAFVLFVLGNLFEINCFAISRACINLFWFYIGIVFEDKREWLDAKLDGRRGRFTLLVGLIYCVLLLVYLSLFKTNFLIYGALAFFAIAEIYLVAGLLKCCGIQSANGYNVFLRYSFSIYLYSDPLNYFFLEVIRTTGKLYLFSQGRFCFFFFCLRTVVTIVTAILIAYILNKCSAIVRNRE